MSLRELVEFLKANEIAEFDMEQDDLKVRIKFAGAAAAAAAGGFDLAQLEPVDGVGAGILRRRLLLHLLRRARLRLHRLLRWRRSCMR